jgi:hypothetical protein
VSKTQEIEIIVLPAQPEPKIKTQQNVLDHSAGPTAPNLSVVTRAARPAEYSSKIAFKELKVTETSAEDVSSPDKVASPSSERTPSYKQLQKPSK